eukprot:TRINITY_DN3976_c0_g1_i1.p1 TRINITY_DN3976_c0_g1~~TRINITY_DN3976_c0_g1_i1.p1  ORF type:complete len:279 (-),score=58.32 TRINITY_DN3976_c0_g1_i1:17-853(-)
MFGRNPTFPQITATPPSRNILEPIFQPQKRVPSDPFRKGRSSGQAPIGAFEKGLWSVQNASLNNIFPPLFLNSIFKSIDNEKHHLKEEILDRTEAIIKSNSKFAIDEAARAHLRVCSLVLASYEVINKKNLITENELIESIKDSMMVMNVKKTVHSLFKVPLRAKNPLTVYSEAFGTLSRLRGKTFDIDFEEDGVSFLTMNVNKCLFHSFFTQNGASHLTHLFCQIESDLLSGIDPSTDNVSFELPAKLATGQKRCKFKFKRMEVISDRDLKACLDCI